ncbi:MAG: DNA translocase FtsK, partial [Oscillospiraceae bacterium]|nr:DNA translocase FtsK [Oscillospiraceae bacterium]
MWGVGFTKEGKLLLLLRDVLNGLFGFGAAKIAIFCPLFLAVSFLHKREKKVAFKTKCVVVFILCFGILHHLTVNDATVATHGAAIVGQFYHQGQLGASGGLICGALAFLLRWAFGKTFTFILIAIIWLLALLAAVEITIPGIVQAIRDLPRKDEEDTPPEDGPNASERVVEFFSRAWNWFRERRDERRSEDDFDDYDDDYDDEDDVVWDNPVTNFFSGRKKSSEAEQKPARKPAALPKPDRARAEEFMRQLEAEINAPVAPAPTENVPFFEAEPVEAAPVPAPVVKPDPAVRKVTANEAAASAQEVTAEIEKAKEAPKVVYKYPPIDLLKHPGRSAADGTAEMKRNSLRLNETLESFKIDAHIINVTRGPSVTRYEVELDKGVRLNKLTTVADDIALSLGVTSVRIAPVPGKISVVGIEVPNMAVTTVALREVIDSREFKTSNSKSTFAVGKDIGGSCIVGNIAKMPHMLIAGTTGSGKSVCMNSIIISLLYKAAPEEVKLIMVDPKMVELGIYNDIPHLLIPVVTDPKKAAGSLQWAVTEMMRRYKMMSDAGVRDLESFNSIVESEQEGEKLPQVVIIIDELADLMLVAAKEVEDSICRIAQMGRAAGMHLIIATQRPSSDVITGLMKANIPSRIAFSVASAMESRIILDTQGAEKLVGKGDMLFAPIGTGKPQRVQGCFVTDGEVEAVATYVKNNFKPSYDTSIMDEIEKTAQQTGKKSGAPEPEANAEEMEGDEMLPQAVEVVFDTKQASVSMLQRRLKLGYARAARIMD